MIFRQIKYNPALQTRTAEAFVAFMLADLPTPPSDHHAIRAANRRWRGDL